MAETFLLNLYRLQALTNIAHGTVYNPFLPPRIRSNTEYVAERVSDERYLFKNDSGGVAVFTGI